MRRAIAGTVLLCALASGHVSAGQRARTPDAANTPAVEIVQSVGCAERRDGAPETWWLARAIDPRATQPGVFSVAQVEAAKALRPGERTFQLVGTADFLDTESLLRSGRRREFTTAQTANATGELRAGRRVLVKGMLVPASEVPRINLLNVVGVSDSCE